MLLSYRTERIEIRYRVVVMIGELMVQQQVNNVWQHMVGVICLNQTHRKQVKRILPDFFKRWPTHISILQDTKEDVEEMIAPLGMRKVRSKRIYRMSEQFESWNGKDATELYGIGKYGSDSYRLFYRNEIPENVGDHELKRYIEEEL
tara:strand:+ start:44 stop:484 length:441 start_codon:yes stop_codon:yes gene_type:complete